MKVYIGYMTSKKGKQFVVLAVGNEQHKTMVTFDIATIARVAEAKIALVYTKPGEWIQI